MRRRFIVEPAYQYGYIVTVAAAAVFVILAIGVLSAMTLYGVAGSAGIDPSTAASIRIQAYRQLIVTAFLIIPTGVAFAAGGFHLSYRSAGPLRRLEQWLEAYLESRERRALSIRAKDDLAGVASRLAIILPALERSKEEGRG